MNEALIKLQIECLEQQLKVLKCKLASKKRKHLSDLDGIFNGKMDFAIEKIKKV
ncbi:MAG: hypothetical protein E3K37_10025 [Candidatus Kuenenia sp.]|nr:hypothetical protein [Candidatus Kuenenia hertensis]